MIRSPVSASSAAAVRGIRIGSRERPPVAGMIPSFTSGRPNFASVEATRSRQASASSRPPPSACPFSAAIVGIGSAATAFTEARRRRL